MDTELADPKEENDTKHPYQRPTLSPAGVLNDVIWLGFRDEDRPIRVEVTSNLLIVTLADGRTIGSPLEWYPSLRLATAKQHVDVSLGKNNLRWNDLNLEISTRDLLIGRKPSPTITE
jgi:hypothetical protein